MKHLSEDQTAGLYSEPIDPIDWLIDNKQEVESKLRDMHEKGREKFNGDPKDPPNLCY